ncbi:MAG: hypothetical protein PHQ23_15970 [Candidatus Wallbacteria bacterium]|nr:hypothetical protein [Candidatus Wallbacteria bacterium]
MAEKMEIKKELTSIRNSKKFLPYSSSGYMANRLSGILAEIRKQSQNPQQGLEFLERFYSCAGPIFSRCDDSSGIIQGVFRYEAQSLFVEYARNHGDQDWLCELLVSMFRKHDYDMCSSLTEEAAQYLDAAHMRSLYERFLTLAEGEDPDWRNESSRCNAYFCAARDLAVSLKDGFLLEKAHRQEYGEEYKKHYLDVAKVFLDAGLPDEALARLPAQGGCPKYELINAEKLLIRAYEMIGDSKKLAALLEQRFERDYSSEALKLIRKHAGPAKARELSAGMKARIMGLESFSHEGMRFLLDTGRIDEADDFIVCRFDRINGRHYDWLLRYAVRMEKEGRWLALTVLYRAMLEAILEKAHLKAYGHAVRYMKKLAALAASVPDWKNITPHSAYFAALAEKNKRKSTLWRKYGGFPG